MAFTSTIDQAILDHFFGLASWTAPTQWWAGYSTADPGKTGAGLAEPDHGTTDYHRVQVLSAGWGRTTSTVDNEAVIEFAPTTGSQGHVTYACLFDGAAGSLIWSAELTVHKDIGSGETPRFAAGDFDVTMS